jgi:hypothetical protein
MALKLPTVAFCEECGNPFYRNMPNKKYCNDTCRQNQWNRRVTGGFRLYELTMRWRIDREKGDMAELTAAADQLAGEERIIRARRNANIKRQQAEYPNGVLPADYKPGESRSKAVSLSKAQQDAACDACVFALAFAAGRIPNDPERIPTGWPDKTLAELRNAIISLGGAIDPAELDG